MIMFYGVNSIYRPIGLLEPVFAKSGVMMSYEYVRTGNDARFLAVKRYREKRAARRRKS